MASKRNLHFAGNMFGQSRNDRLTYAVTKSLNKLIEELSELRYAADRVAAGKDADSEVICELLDVLGVISTSFRSRHPLTEEWEGIMDVMVSDQILGDLELYNVIYEVIFAAKRADPLECVSFDQVLDRWMRSQAARGRQFDRDEMVGFVAALLDID